jgi:hypothetical protein
MKILLSSLLILLSTGCVMQRTVEITFENGRPTKRALTQVAWFHKTALDNVVFHKNSTNVLLSMDKASAETQPESLDAMGRLIGIAAGTAAKTAATK